MNSSYKSVRGAYHDSCDKIAYATRVLAEAALRKCMALGRSEKSVYLCSGCRMYHLTRKAPDSLYEIADVGVIENGQDHLTVGRVTQSGRADVLLRLSRDRGGRTCYLSTRLRREAATELLDLLIDALYGAPGEEGASSPVTPDRQGSDAHERGRP